MIVHKKRRTFWQWLADKAHVQTTVDLAERDRWFESGIRVGIAIVTEKPVHDNFHHYGQIIAEQASGAMAAIKLARTLEVGEQRPTPEPEIPQPIKSGIRQRAEEREITAVMRTPTAQLFPPVEQITGKLLPLESVIGPNSTQSLPAVNARTGYYVKGDHRLARKANLWQQKQRKSG